MIRDVMYGGKLVLFSDELSIAPVLLGGSTHVVAEPIGQGAAVAALASRRSSRQVIPFPRHRSPRDG